MVAFTTRGVFTSADEDDHHDKTCNPFTSNFMFELRMQKRKESWLNRKQACIASMSCSSTCSSGDLRKTFNLIDYNNKGFVTIEDLTAYAEANGMPACYAESFMKAVRGSNQLSSASGTVKFQAFSKFVKSREAALRRAFDRFDTNGDGQISVKELESSLRHIAITCPTSRCISRCNKKMAKEMFSRIGGQRYRSVDFCKFRQFFLLLPSEELIVSYWMGQGRCPDLDSRVLIHDENDATKASPWGHLLAGAVAGATSRTATAPLETMRLAVMTGSIEPSGFGKVRLCHWNLPVLGRCACVTRTFRFWEGAPVSLEPSGFGKVATCVTRTFRFWEGAPVSIEPSGFGKVRLCHWNLPVLGRCTCVNRTFRFWEGAPVSIEPSGFGKNAAAIMEKGGGWRALFRGNAVNVMRSAPSKALDFFAFDTFKRMLGDSGSYLNTFLAAGLAGAASWTCLYPLEVVRSRVTCGSVPSAALAGGVNPFRIMSHISATEGWRALYRGLGWSVAAIIPEASICYGLHDALKRSYKERMGGDPDVMTSLTFGVLSAFTGQLVACPMETVSRRLQMSGAPGLDIIIKDISSAGIQNFYRGVGASTIRLIPMACISFGTYELVRAALVRLEEWRLESETSNDITQHCLPLQSDAPCAS
ncbi:hypothetical protein CEUSTIGMA_g6100.t1 [Chlamydomonas eustigma]|uniref:EF-hand domain-containing protein n=1 Tax=Chlamydomonas eustigma TaxID=1157962 RepID=A0A250X6Z5_9CHLO|nr:hypothetical protein CEUSTIGMA_g6100.t1 [Chlamydomonas eustigma]|eukprot:GAX78662.1 hypothetical protein CEUSTIGMA_g6100.t1 [Chlamydomonas eustigma]